MQASTTEPNSSRRTRAGNASKHPGQPDVPAKRRTPAQKQADDAHLLDHESMKNANALLTLANIASVEEAMETSQTAKRTAAAKKGVRPSTKKSIKDGASAANIPAGKPHLVPATGIMF
ncbi:hypothetical protein EV363DRAFT_1198796 [Boletus edulis]|nr:hypothetical protein EV363DRAFT_1198796 [Boletus edulis]